MADRIEREIEEILRKIDDFVPERARRQTRRVGQPFSAAGSWFARRLARISLNQVMAWSLVTLLIAFFAWIMIGALVVLVTAFLFSMGRSTGGRPVEKRWRGQPMDLSGPSWPDRVKAWIKGNKGKRRR
jgi:hypothetical protein